MFADFISQGKFLCLLTFICRFAGSDYDCGVFACMFVNFISQDFPLVFSQKYVTQCRERIALSVLNGKIPSIEPM